MKKLLLLASQHGNERLGDHLLAHIKKERPSLLPHVSFKIANPKAYDQNVRYVESDMNRSFDPALQTYEAVQAQRIIEYITHEQFDMVLDLHTTVCKQPPCFIVRDITSDNKAYLSASSIDRIVIMKDEIVQRSLIGTIAKSISIEVANDNIDNAFLNTLCDDIERYVSGQKSHKRHYSYTVQGLLLKTEIKEADALRLKNFEMSPYGFVPVLVGENSYKKNTHYLGFKASEKTTITL